MNKLIKWIIIGFIVWPIIFIVTVAVITFNILSQ